MALFYHRGGRKVKEILAPFPIVNKCTRGFSALFRPSSQENASPPPDAILDGFGAAFRKGKFDLRHFAQSRENKFPDRLIFVVFCFIFLLTIPKGKCHLPIRHSFFLFLPLPHPYFRSKHSVQTLQIGVVFFYICTFCTKTIFLTECSFLQRFFPPYFPFPPSPIARHSSPYKHLFLASFIYFCRGAARRVGFSRNRARATFPTPKAVTPRPFFTCASPLALHRHSDHLIIYSTSPKKAVDRRLSNIFLRKSKKYSKRGLTK